MLLAVQTTRAKPPTPNTYWIDNQSNAFNILPRVLLLVLYHGKICRLHCWCRKDILPPGREIWWDGYGKWICASHPLLRMKRGKITSKTFFYVVIVIFSISKKYFTSSPEIFSLPAPSTAAPKKSAAILEPHCELESINHQLHFG